MTQRPPHRRIVLMAVAGAVMAGVAGTGIAQPMDIQGQVAFAGGKAIPEGRIEIYIEDTAMAQRRIATIEVASDGGAKAIAFSIALAGTGSPTLQIVARLERADGWLLARGTAGISADATVNITLNEAVY